jgi:hypothetical protein
MAESAKMLPLAAREHCMATSQPHDQLDDQLRADLDRHGIRIIRKLSYEWQGYSNAAEPAAAAKRAAR